LRDALIFYDEIIGSQAIDDLAALILYKCRDGDNVGTSAKHGFLRASKHGEKQAEQDGTPLPCCDHSFKLNRDFNSAIERIAN